MNRKLCFPAIAALVLVLSEIALHAQQRPSPNVGGKPRDPFLKDRGAPVTPPDTSENLTAITVVFESYSLDQDDASGLLALLPDGPARYTRMAELVAAGRARLADVRACSTKSGMHAALDSMDTANLASQYYPPTRRDDTPVAALLSEVHYGERMQFDAMLGPDARTCNLNFSFSVERLHGFTEFRTDAHGKPVAMANHGKREILTSLVVRTGEPIFLGTLNPPIAPGAAAISMEVVFGRVLVNKDRPEAAAPAIGSVGYAEHVMMFYSLDRGAARDLVVGNVKPGACFAAVRALAEKKQAKLEHVFALASQSGVRARSDENIVAHEPGGTAPGVGLTEVMAPGEAGTPPAVAAFPYIRTLSGKNHGLGLELESIVGPADALLKGLPLAANLKLTLYWRMDTGHFKPAGIPPLYPETGTQEQRRLDNVVTCYVGVPTFLGTLNPPRDSGVNDRKDSGRVWLAFVQVTPVKP